MTLSAMGTNRNRAMPSRKNIGTKTMQMHSNDTKAGTTICEAPSMIAVSTGLPLFQMIVDALDGHGRFVDQYADGQSEAAQRHDIERLAQDIEGADRPENG